MNGARTRPAVEAVNADPALEAYIRLIVAQAPPLTPEVRGRLREIVGASDGRQ